MKSAVEGDEDQIAALEGAGLETLRAAWRRRIGSPPKLRSPELLSLMLAFRLQAARYGGLDADARRALRRPKAERAGPVAAAGVRLCREWLGETHEVTALGDGGFLYRGERYRSLSLIARKITGARWNGPRFFGLRTGGKS